MLVYEKNTIAYCSVTGDSNSRSSGCQCGHRDRHTSARRGDCPADSGRGPAGCSRDAARGGGGAAGGCSPRPSLLWLGARVLRLPSRVLSVRLGPGLVWPRGPAEWLPLWVGRSPRRRLSRRSSLRIKHRIQRMENGESPGSPGTLRFQGPGESSWAQARVALTSCSSTFSFFRA
jgi:hypothetical protein